MKNLEYRSLTRLFNAFLIFHIINLNKQYIIKLSKKYGKSLAQIALNWIVNKKNILPIPKFSTFEHFQEIYESDFKIDHDDLEYIKGKLWWTN